MRGAGQKTFLPCFVRAAQGLSSAVGKEGCAFFFGQPLRPRCLAQLCTMGLGTLPWLTQDPPPGCGHPRFQLCLRTERSLGRVPMTPMERIFQRTGGGASRAWQASLAPPPPPKPRMVRLLADQTSRDARWIPGKPSQRLRIVQGDLSLCGFSNPAVPPAISPLQGHGRPCGDACLLLNPAGAFSCLTRLERH